MGGGSGGYERPSDSGGSGGESSESDSVPPPESDNEEETDEDQSDESNETSEGTTPESPPVTGGGGGSGVPESGPGDDSNGTPGEDDSESERDDPSPDEGTEDGESEGQEDNSGHNDEESEKQNRTDSGPEDESDDADSNNAEQEGGQENHEEDQGDKEHESDNEDVEDDDEDGNGEDECLIAESALLHSPNPEPLGDVDEGDICSVRLREEAICIVDSRGRTIGAIAEPWVGTLKECIEQGRQYRGRVLNIDGGKCEVRVTNKCLVNQDVNLTATNTAVRDQLHPELSLSVEKTTEEVIVVTDDGARVGDVPDPWARLLNECLDQGRSYQAEVREVTPEYCRVNIQTGASDE